MLVVNVESLFIHCYIYTTYCTYTFCVYTFNTEEVAQNENK